MDKLKNKQNILFQSLCLIFISLSGCHSVQELSSSVEDYKALQSDPRLFIGKYYEVRPTTRFPASREVQTILNLRQQVKDKGLSPASVRTTLGKGFGKEYIDSGLIQNINSSMDIEDKQVKLIFKITDTYKPDIGNTLVKIKVLNKKYLDSEWWITTDELVDIANQIESPPK